MAKKKPTKGRKSMPATETDPHKGVQINLRVIDSRLVDALDEYARRQMRSRNNALNHILEQALRKVGLWPPAGDEDE